MVGHGCVGWHTTRGRTVTLYSRGCDLCLTAACVRRLLQPNLSNSNPTAGHTFCYSIDTSNCQLRSVFIDNTVNKLLNAQWRRWWRHGCGNDVESLCVMSALHAGHWALHNLCKLSKGPSTLWQWATVYCCQGRYCYNEPLSRLTIQIHTCVPSAIMQYAFVYGCLLFGVLSLQICQSLDDTLHYY